MPWTFNISTYFGSPAAEISTVFGQLTFSGSYVTAVGGDTGTFVLGGNTISLPVYLQASAFHATRPPLIYQIQLDGGFIGLVTFPATGATATNFRIKIIVTSTGNELASGTYAANAAALVAATAVNTMLLNYKANL